jgi:hypothetical protein
MQHERLFTLTFNGINDLGIAARAQRRNDDGLGLTTSENSRPMCARQDADFDVDRTYRAPVAAIDAGLALNDALVNDALAHDVLLELVQLTLNVFSRPFGVFATGKRFNRGVLGNANGGLTILLVSDLVRVGKTAGRGGGDCCCEVFVGFRRRIATCIFS